MNQEAGTAQINHPQSQHQVPELEITGQEGIQGEGPFMRMHLTLVGDRVSTARFDTYGCPYAIACGDWVATWVSGKSVAQALALEPADLSRILGGLPLGKEHCASLAVGALRGAIRAWSAGTGAIPNRE